MAPLSNSFAIGVWLREEPLYSRVQTQEYVTARSTFVDYIALCDIDDRHERNIFTGKGSVARGRSHCIRNHSRVDGPGYDIAGIYS